MIKSICCMCGVQYGTKYDSDPTPRKSHGYCPVCFAVAVARMHADLEKMESSQPQPRTA